MESVLFFPLPGPTYPPQHTPTSNQCAAVDLAEYPVVCMCVCVRVHVRACALYAL